MIEDILDTDAIEQLLNRDYVAINDFAGDKNALQDKILYNRDFRSRHNKISVIFTSQYYFKSDANDMEESEIAKKQSWQHD